MRDSLIYDWNVVEPSARPPVVMFDDETLRDGLQSPSVRTPSIDQKIRILHLIDAVGIDTTDLGLPGAGPHVVGDVERLAREIIDAKLSVQANCAARTMVADVAPIAEIVQRTGLPIECCCFIGSSPLRLYAEDWTVDYLQRCTDEAVSFAVKQGLKVMYVTEDTTRADPDTLRELYTAAIRAGAARVCGLDPVRQPVAVKRPLTEHAADPLAPERAREAIASGVHRALDRLVEALLEELVGHIDEFDDTARGLPLTGVLAPNLRGAIISYFEEEMRHSTLSEHHEAQSTTGRHRQVRVPALIVAGWHDLYLAADLQHFSELRSEGATETARRDTALLVGPWAHGVFGDFARYAPLDASPKEMGNIMKAFYADAPSLKPPPRPAGWSDVAEKLRNIYELVLKK